MEKRTVYHIVEWIIALAGCGFLAWKLATYDDYDSLVASLRTMDWPQWTALGLCLLLMPVNMLIEAWKWRTLIPMSWKEANRQIYYSKLAGLITPWRLGEYPARGLLMVNGDRLSVSGERIWSKVLSMGAVGSATMTAAIIIAGIVSLVFLGDIVFLDGKGYYILIGGVLLVLCIALYFAPRLLRRWADVSHRLILISLGQSFVRLACWYVQLALVLFALGGLGDLGILGGLGFTAVYYLLVTITPNVPIAEAGVRGAWAIVLFGTANAALAGVLLWAINTLIPCMIWPFLRRFR